ncbi:DinB superfamily protein [Evansella caseinilytica]|uniref:DinB superfamily protein n=1 Tax=Evansella caseinilytica TaxID=1503961 RepID=A0A1H3PLS0_9BACI|nr:DinB family protein [Evansella caseinilytica]SDZ01835.1 DinB superfamily protein [Evansella caseinilytica]
MDVKEMLIRQLKACHGENTWFVPLNVALDGLTQEQAAWKSEESTNSIWEIVNHLIYYNERYLNKFQGIRNKQSAESITATFKNAKKLSWSDAVDQINTIMSDWMKAVKEGNEKQLDEWSADIAYLTVHTTYHIGQIVAIRKQQGSWNPKQGVYE